MENQYKRLFDSIAPIKSDEELLRAVLDRKAEKMSSKKKFSKKAILIPVAAAALLGTTAIGVSAAYQWNLPAAFEDLFRNRFEEYNGTSGSKMKNVMFDFSVIGKELDLTFNFENCDVVIKGIAADEHSAYLLYDVVFAEDYDFTLANGEEWSVNLRPNIDMSLVKNYDGEVHPSVECINGFMNMEDSIAHCFSTVNISGISLQDKPIVYSFDSLVRKSGDKEDVLELEEKKFSVDMDFCLSGNSVELRPNESITLESGETGTVNYIGLSTFGLELNVEWEDEYLKETNMCEKLKNAVTINYKDGTTSDSTTFTSQYLGGSGRSFNSRTDDNSYYSSVLLSWVYPVYMQDIKSVTIGGKTYKVETVDNDPELAPFDFSSVGTAIGESRKGEGYTLTIDGVVADTHTAHFMYTIEFNDKFPYDYKHTDVDDTGWFDWGVRDFEITINGVQANTGSSISGADNIWLNDNTLRGSFTIGCGDMSFENSDITLNIGTLRRPHITDCLLDDEQKIDCGMSFDFRTGDMSGMERSAAPNKTIALEGIGNAVVTEVNITPFRLNYTILPADGQKVSFEEFFNAIFADDGGICITLKNGVNISATTCTSAPMNGGIECSVELSYPVNPADVVNITLCGHKIELSSAAANVTAQSSSDKSGYDFSKLDGKELGQTIKGSGFTLNLDKVVADVHNAYIFYTLKFDEDTDYVSGTPGNWTFNYDVKLDGKSRSHSLSDSRPYLEDSVLKGSFGLTFSEYDLTGKTITLSFNSLDYSKTTLSSLGEKHIGFIESADIVMDFDLRLNKTLTLTPNIEIEFDGLIAVLSEVTVTPFGMSYSVALPMEQLDDTDKYFEFLGKVQEELKNFGYGAPLITFADGSVGYDLINGGSGCAGETFRSECRFTRLIDTSDIRSINFGKYVVDVG